MAARRASVKRKDDVVAVVTGDLIGSSRMKPKQMNDAREALQQASVDMDSAFDLLHGELAVFRGDGWQIVVRKPALALRAAVMMRAGLLATGIGDTRTSVGIGRYDQIVDGDVGVSTGEAFTLSGRGLDEITRRMAKMQLSLPDRAGRLADWGAAAMTVCSVLMDGWTRRQAEIAFARLERADITLSVLAKGLSITQQSVSESLEGAGFSALEAVLSAFETEDWVAGLS